MRGNTFCRNFLDSVFCYPPSLWYGTKPPGVLSREFCPVLSRPPKKKRPGSRTLAFSCGYWSEREDLNLRPLHPQCSALPSCATFRVLSKPALSRGRNHTEFSDLCKPKRWTEGKIAVSQQVQALRPARISSSSLMVWLISWRTCVASSRASSPPRRWRAPPMVKPCS